MDWHTQSIKEVFERLQSSSVGLPSHSVLERLKKYGENRLKETAQFNILRVLSEQLKSFLILLLLFAALIAFFMKSKVDASVIIVIVIINVGLGFFQEYKAEKAIKDLKKLLVPKTIVIRNGKRIIINSELIVPGDIIIIEEGTKITADARIIESNGLKINESSLTGESASVEKTVRKLTGTIALAERINMVYQGTEVISGNGKIIVVSTGMNTQIGKISELVQKIQPEKNPFKDKLDQFAKKIGLFVIGLSILIVLLLVATGTELLDSFLIAVSLAVSAIPEGLPAVISLCLAFATRRMIQQNVLVRKLPAAETLGRTTIICTDKTGTLTEGKMEVATIYTNGKINPFKEKEKLLRIGVLCNNAHQEKKEEGEHFTGDPTEIALIISAKNNFIDKEEATEQEPKIKEFPFNSERKMMSVLRKSHTKIISYVKGAPEKIIQKCQYELINGEKIRLEEKDKKRLHVVYECLAKEGLRVLAFAYTEFPHYMKAEDITEKQAEEELIFVGFQGMIDPPRGEVKNSIKLCKEAGIRVMMITGDSKLTAQAVAKQIGLTGNTIDAKELSEMTDRELFDEIKTISIFSRITPEDKLRIINILKQRNEIVAMTGDGVNDALALKRADIGIAMGIRGTDVAKDAASIIITDDNFASIVMGVKEGRTIYDNTKKFMKFLLTSNFSEVIIVLLVMLIWRDPALLPLLPLQILWINLITDSFPALALTTELPEKNIMKRGPSKHELINGIKKFIFFGGLIATIIGISIFITYMDNIDKARTMVVTASVMFQMFLVFNSKSEQSMLKSPFNKYIFYAVGFSLFLHGIVLYTSLNTIFHFVPLLFVDWLRIIILTFIGFVCMEGIKIWGK